MREIVGSTEALAVNIVDLDLQESQSLDCAHKPKKEEKIAQKYQNYTSLTLKCIHPSKKGRILRAVHK